MRPTTVVPVEALRQTALLLDAVVAGAQIDLLVLDLPPQPSDEDVVMASPAPVHADMDRVFLEAATVLLATRLSMGGGVGVVASVFGSCALIGNNLAILAPAIYLMGARC